MASGIYNRFKYNVMKKLIDMSTDTIIIILLNASHAFDADHNTLSQITANQLATAGGYTQDTKVVSSITVTQDDTNDLAYIDAPDVSWTSATFTAYHAVLVDSSVSDNLICSIDFGGAKSVTAGTFLIQWAATGILKIS